MLLDISDPIVIVGVILSYGAGLGGLFGYMKLKAWSMLKNNITDIKLSERLKIHEELLIDIKIRLDALEIEEKSQKIQQISQELVGNNEILEKTIKNNKESKITSEKSVPIPNTINSDFENPTHHVLHLVTNKAMTSRDIQIRLKKSREHTSRFMKKLYEEGLVQRNSKNKPYTYTITDKGKMEILSYTITGKEKIEIEEIITNSLS